MPDQYRAPPHTGLFIASISPTIPPISLQYLAQLTAVGISQ